MDIPTSSSELMETLSNMAEEIAQKIMDGIFDMPEELDEEMVGILEEIGRHGVEMPNGENCIVITPKGFKEYWKKSRKGTSSSVSGIHVGHYKVLVESEEISNFLDKPVNLITMTGCAPKQWSRGLTVMLEKIAGAVFVNKLQEILLLEAGFSMRNKLVFGK